ncbi:hypothetical protein LCGC14_1916320 [marine sediment metagenome]|uniref:Uncharacterized protein n=1 Tax=marine sediment metagenome TaxID=412755 RepID=A0A0F9FSX2_9ZZZZ
MRFILILIGGLSFFLAINIGAAAMLGDEQLGLIAYKQAVGFFFGFWLAWITRTM